MDVKITVDEHGRVEPGGSAVCTELKPTILGHLGGPIVSRVYMCQTCHALFEACAGRVYSHECMVSLAEQT